jgi:hypothetical protein
MYTLEVLSGDITITLAENVSISEIPHQPYVIESTETGIRDKTTPIISNVTTTNITTDSVIITWKTDEPSDSLVKYGTESRNYTLQKYDPENVTLHCLNLTGLQPNTTYYFVVNSTDQRGNSNESSEHSFTTLETLKVFDTGEGTYPSIFGTHNGTIKPSPDVIVNKMYTYPCPGTGGHAEWVAFYNSTTDEEIANGTWEGYAVGDYHYIKFDKEFVLHEGVTYNYTIKTGSYPQIIHEHVFNTPDGEITCSSFVDANGKVYADWIPAIRLE